MTGGKDACNMTATTQRSQLESSRIQKLNLASANGENIQILEGEDSERKFGENSVAFTDFFKESLLI